MSKEKRRVPKLRFPGFTEDWEQRKFGDLFEYERPDAYIVKSDNYNNDFNMPVLTANKAFILGYTNEANSYNKPSIIFDDFTLDRKYVDFPYMLKSSAIKILTSKNQHNLRFLFERLNSTRFEVLGHARHYISVVQNTTTLCPSIDEEVCISNLLTKFDELITLHQRKLDNLKLKKKALLQKLFSKNGERYPELRFPGFTDAWEQRKLGDVIVSLYNGQTPSRFDKANWEGDIPWLTSGELNRGVVNHSIEKITQQGRDDANLKIVPKGTVVIAITGLEAAGTRGNCAKLGFDTTLNQSCMAIYPKSEFLDPDFLFQWYIAVGEEYGIKYTQGTKQQSYNAELIKILPISVPRVTEQRKITCILDSFDDIITLHQRKLDHLKLQKKALLQQMFV